MRKEVSIIPMMAASPHSHMGHRIDLGEKLATLPGLHIVGLSALPGVLHPEVRYEILCQQWNGIRPLIELTSSAGAMAAMARNFGTVLHILVGEDRRKKLGEGLKKSLEAGKIKEMDGRFFDEIHIHTPGAGRAHGMSGTSMRQAIADENFEEYKRHLGPLSREDTQALYSVLCANYRLGLLPVKRKT